MSPRIAVPLPLEIWFLIADFICIMSTNLNDIYEAFDSIALIFLTDDHTEEDKVEIVKALNLYLLHRISDNTRSRLGHSSSANCVTFKVTDEDPETGIPDLIFTRSEKLEETMLSLGDFVLDGITDSEELDGSKPDNLLKPLLSSRRITTLYHSLTFSLDDANGAEILSIPRLFITSSIVRLFLDTDNLDKDEVRNLNRIFQSFPNLEAFHWRGFKYLDVGEGHPSHSTQRLKFEALLIPTKLKVLELTSTNRPRNLEHFNRNTYPRYQPIPINRLAITERLLEWNSKLDILHINVLLGEYLDGPRKANHQFQLSAQDPKDIEEDWQVMAYPNSSVKWYPGGHADHRVIFSTKDKLPVFKAVRLAC
ncbi:hypothetical protein TWF481_002778 [Arthrobotrys musiformis]|uniref:Uncharacterized protein n=1 Tax=Arthrobotrys musiformis TaxID=47236 RepID=A0AAV9VT56_9PEZI